MSQQIQGRVVAPAIIVQCIQQIKNGKDNMETIGLHLTTLFMVVIVPNDMKSSIYSNIIEASHYLMP